MVKEVVQRNLQVENGGNYRVGEQFLPVLLYTPIKELARTIGEKRANVIGFIDSKKEGKLHEVGSGKVVKRFEEHLAFLQALHKTTEFSVRMALQTEETKTSTKRRASVSFDNGENVCLELETTGDKTSLTYFTGDPSKNLGAPYVRWTSTPGKIDSKEEVETGWRIEEAEGKETYLPFYCNKRSIVDYNEKRQVKALLKNFDQWFDDEFTAEVLADLKEYLSDESPFTAEEFFADADISLRRIPQPSPKKVEQPAPVVPPITQLTPNIVEQPISIDHLSVNLLKDFPPFNKLKDILQKIPMNWERLEERFILPGRSAERSYGTSPESMAKHVMNLLGRMVELHVDLALRDIAERNLVPGLIIDPDLENKQTEHFKFVRRDANIVAINKKTNQDVAEYDRIVEIQGIPVVFEVKRGKAQTLKDAMTNIKNKFDPLVEYYVTVLGRENKFAYIVVTTSDAIDPSVKPAQQTFINKGGQLFGLPISYNALLDEGKSVASKFVLN